jgi:hypothetical protein
MAFSIRNDRACENGIGRARAFTRPSVSAVME